MKMRDKMQSKLKIKKGMFKSFSEYPVNPLIWIAIIIFFILDCMDLLEIVED